MAPVSWVMESVGHALQWVLLTPYSLSGQRAHGCSSLSDVVPSGQIAKRKQNT